MAEHVAAFVRGMSAAGVITTVKHFPGLGRVRGNTDTTSGVTDGQTTPNDPDLQPFAIGAGAGASWLMISFAIYTQIDAHSPAVFSPTIIQGLARDRLGIGGLIVSDDLGRRCRSPTSIPVPGPSASSSQAATWSSPPTRTPSAP